MPGSIDRPVSDWRDFVGLRGVDAPGAGDVLAAFVWLSFGLAYWLVFEGHRGSVVGAGTLSLVAVLGLVDDGNGVERLVAKIRRFEAGDETVDFSTERDDALGALYDAVGDLAAGVVERERELAESERYRKSLYEVTSDTDLSGEEKIQRLLELGRERLDVEAGFVSRIDRATDRYEIELAAGTDLVAVGSQTDLSEMYCERTIETDDVLGIYDAETEGWGDHPSAERRGISCYLGGKILVDGDVYGTVCFVDPEPRVKPFSQDEKVFADLMSRWISHVYERREREGALRETNERLGAVIRASPAAIVALDRDGTVELWNPAAERIFGWSEDEVLGRALPFVPADREGEFRRYLDRLLAGKSLVGVETKRLRKDGSLIDVSLSAAPIRDDDGEVVGIMGALEDVSERKDHERELERYREYTDDLLDAIDDVFYVLDEDGAVQRWNETLQTVSGYAAAEIADMHALEFFAEAERDRMIEAMADAFETGSTRIEGNLVTKDGEGVPYEFVAVALEGLEGNPVLVGIGRDISERMETERRLSRLIDNIPGLVYRVRNEPDWPTEFVSEGVREITGYGPEQLESDEVTWGEDVIVEQNEAIWEEVQAALERREPFRLTYPIESADGERRWVKEQGRGIYAADGSVEALEGVVIDVTDRIEYERALERTQRLLEQSQRLASVGAWEIQLADGEPVDLILTDEAYRIHDLPTGTPLSLEDAFEFYHPDDRVRVRDGVERAIRDGERYDVEARLVTAGGDQRWVRTIAGPVREDGEIVAVRGSIQDVTRRKEREAALERTSDLLAQAQRMAEVGGWELDLATDELTVTDRFRRIHGLGPDEPLSLETILSYYHPEDVDHIEETLAVAIETGESYDIEVRLGTTDGDRRWVRILGEPVEEGGEVVKLRGSMQDVTAEKERERALRTLHDTARALLQTDTDAAVADLVVETATAVIDAAGVCLYLLDSATNELAPAACTEAYEAATGGAPPVAVGDEDDPAWTSFATGTRRIFNDGDDYPADLFGGDVGGALVVPIGDHGVLVVTRSRPGIPERTRQLVETLVATTEAALDRLESEATIRERDAELEARNRRLQRQIQLTNVIRRVDQSLIGATSREEVETAVAEELAAAGDVAFAWLGTVDASGDRLVPRAWAGTDGSYLDAVSLELAGGEVEPAARTTRTGEPTVVTNVVSELAGEAWRKRALEYGFRSALAVPIAFEEYRYGVLAVYADVAGAFEDLERAVFAELGQTIANAITAVQTREALHADTLLELSLHVTAPESSLAQVARRAGCDVEYVGTAARSDDVTRLFFAVEAGDDSDVEAALADLVTVEDYRSLGEAGGRRVYETAVSGPVLSATLIRHGARPQSIRATPSGVSVVVQVPTATDVREFVEMLRETHGDVELVGRRTVSRPTRTREQLVSDLLGALTDRQREVLRTAFYAGYFDWPRGSTGEEVAEMLAVSQPTISRHLRLGQRRLLAQLFEEEAAEVAT